LEREGDSALQRYVNLQEASFMDLQTTGKMRSSNFNLTNNLMSLRMMHPQQTTLFPVDGLPKPKESERLNYT